MKRDDSGLIRCLVERLLTTPPAATWCTWVGLELRWAWRICLPAMRTAAILVARLRIGGSPHLSFLAADVGAMAPRMLHT